MCCSFSSSKLRHSNCVLYFRTTLLQRPNSASRQTTISSRRAFGRSGKIPKTSTAASGHFRSRISGQSLSMTCGCTHSSRPSAKPSRTMVTRKLWELLWTYVRVSTVLDFGRGPSARAFPVTKTDGRPLRARKCSNQLADDSRKSSESVQMTVLSSQDTRIAPTVAAQGPRPSTLFKAVGLGSAFMTIHEFWIRFRKWNDGAFHGHGGWRIEDCTASWGWIYRTAPPATPSIRCWWLASRHQLLPFHALFLTSLYHLYWSSIYGVRRKQSAAKSQQKQRQGIMNSIIYICTSRRFLL